MRATTRHFAEFLTEAVVDFTNAVQGGGSSDVQGSRGAQALAVAIGGGDAVLLVKALPKCEVTGDDPILDLCDVTGDDSVMICELTG